MIVTLPPELEKRIQEKLARGDFFSEQALVQEAVHRLIEEDEVAGQDQDQDALRQQLRMADAEIDRGEGLEFNEHTTKDLARGIHERGINRLTDLQNAGPH